MKYILTDSIWKDDSFDRITNYHVNKIRANDINDVFVVGSFGEFLHFNGVGWKNDYEEPNLEGGAYGSVKITGDLVIATGYNYRKAVILVGRR